MNPILYHYPLSTSCRSIYLVAAEIGLELDMRLVDLKNKSLSTEFIKINPQQTVPTLDDNGFILWDSHAICIYLVDKYATNHQIYPIDLELRATINQRIFFNAYLLFPATKQIFYPILFEKNSDGITEKHRKIAETAFIMLNQLFVNDELYLCGNTMTICDLNAVITVDHLTLVQPIEDYPKVKRWMMEMNELPYFHELNVKYSMEFKQTVLDAIENNKKVNLV